MSTLLMSTNLVEPFFSTPTDSKEYLHSFSDSLINFSPPANGSLSSHELINSNGTMALMGGALVGGNHHHNHNHSHHHLGSHHMLGSHSTLSDIFKCVEDVDQYDVDFGSQHHTLCSPCLIDEYNIDVEASNNNWTNKSPDQWQATEVADWIRDWARQNEIQDIEVAHLLYNQMPGSDLCQMQREYFTSVCPQYGSLIYESLQQLVHQFRSSSHNSYMNSFSMHGSPSAMLPPPAQSNVLHLSNGSSSHSGHGSPDDSHHSTMTSMNGGNHHALNGNDHAHQQHNHNHLHHHQQQSMEHFFPSMSTLEHMMPSSALLFDAQTSQLNYSPSYTSVSDSDRESTSSNLSGVNERRMHINSYYGTQGCAAISPDVAESVVLSASRPSTAAIAAIVATKGNSITNSSHSSMPVSSAAAKRAGRRGRPPKKEAKSRSKGNNKLWEFIRDLLLNPITNPSLIRWERREDGVFKFIQSDKVAKMWGERKQNPRMTYEKLSRAMRYYYKSQVLLPVFGRRLVYKFGPNATGWRPQYDMPKPPGYSG